MPLSELKHVNNLGLNQRCTEAVYTPRMNDREHHSDDIMGAMASQITSLTIVYSNVYSRRSKKA